MINICCPIFFSKDLYQFGFEPKYRLQKYLCKNCKRLFTKRSFKKKQTKYPKCPICCKGTYLHHDYTYYSNFICNDKACSHSIKLIKDSTMKNSSSEFIKSAGRPFKKMRTNAKIIIDALYMYFVNSSYIRAISNLFKDRYDFYISHISIHKLINKFFYAFKYISKSLIPGSLNQFDEWHVDKTVINIHGNRFYIWTLIDSKTRYLIDYHLTKSIKATEALALFYFAKKSHSSQNSIVSDRLLSSTMPAKTIFNKSKHIKVQKFFDNIDNNLIESFFSKFKAHYKAKRGLKSFKSTYINF